MLWSATKRKRTKRTDTELEAVGDQRALPHCGDQDRGEVALPKISPPPPILGWARFASSSSASAKPVMAEGCDRVGLPL